MAQKTILCVDSDRHVLELLSFNLQSAGYTIITATTAAEAITASYCADLILLDPLLPDIDGLELIKRFKSAGITAPIIILSVRDDEVDKVLAFELGADDYVTKPFSIRILLARVKALLRTKQPSPPPGIVRNGPLVINTETYEVFLNGEKLELTLKQYQILFLLAKHPGRLFERQYILDTIWGVNSFVETRNVDVQIRHIWEKLGEEKRLIETLRFVGYRMKKVE